MATNTTDRKSNIFPKRQIKKRIISKIKTPWLILKILIVIVFVYIALNIIQDSIKIYFELKSEETLLKNRHILSIRIVTIAYKFKVYSDFLALSVSKYEDDLNNVKQYGTDLNKGRLWYWNNVFKAIRNDADSTITNFKKLMDNVYPRNEYYTGFIKYFDDNKQNIFNYIDELEGYQKLHNIIIGIDEKYTFDLIRISSGMDDKITEYSVEKAFLKSNILSMGSQRNQQLQNILASVLTLFFVYISISEFKIFKRSKNLN